MCSTSQDSIHISKEGKLLTLVFSNSDDYNSYKTNYNDALADANVSNYSSDPASINYYKFWVFNLIVGNSCGDALNYYQVISHISNPINFNDGTLTISTTIDSIVENGYVPANSCDFVGQSTASMAYSNNYYSSNNYNFAATTHLKGGFGCYYISSIARDDTDKRFRLWYFIPSADICDLASKGWNTPPNYTAWQWELVFVNDRVVITNSADPIHNFRLERWMDANGHDLTSNPIIIYEIINGTVTVNRGFPN